MHRIPHTNQGIKVNGAWNNAEGNDPTFAKGWGDALGCVCVCVCVGGGGGVRACVRSCVRSCVRACVYVCITV